MPLAGAVPSAAILLLVVLSAEGQPFKGLVPKNGCVDLVGNNVTATADAAAMCYQRSAVDEEAKPSKTVVDVTPLAVLLPRPLLLNGAASVPSPASARQFVPPPMPADVPAPTPGASPEVEDNMGLSWQQRHGAAGLSPWGLRSSFSLCETPMIYLIHATIYLTQTLSVDDASVVDGDSDGDRELFDCAICMETVPGTRKFSVGSCGHAFCSRCVAQYVAAKLGENVARVKCPDPSCKNGAVEPESCFGIISSDLLDKWGFLLCESALGGKRVYCPFRECSAPLLADGEGGAAAIAEAECPHCHRLFCARCAAPWHAGVGCKEFQELSQDERGREDLLLRLLAGRQRWQRCPECKMYVEKSEGCNYIKCRCGCSFCYRCASKVSAQTHYCGMCKR